MMNFIIHHLSFIIVSVRRGDSGARRLRRQRVIRTAWGRTRYEVVAGPRAPGAGNLRTEKQPEYQPRSAVNA